jgi:replication-associated recombination protein RarA
MNIRPIFGANDDDQCSLTVITSYLSHPHTMSTAVEKAVDDHKEHEDASRKRKTAGSAGNDMPWVERYRPRVLGDVVGNEETLVRLQAIAEDGNMPNLILCGPPGTGKVNECMIASCCANGLMCLQARTCL